MALSPLLSPLLLALAAALALPQHAAASAAPALDAVRIDFASTSAGPITHRGSGILCKYTPNPPAAWDLRVFSDISPVDPDGFSADASLPPSNYSRAVKLQHYRGGGGHSAPGCKHPSDLPLPVMYGSILTDCLSISDELDQGAGFDRLWASAEAMILRAHSEDAEAILVICDLWGKFDNGAGKANLPGQNGSWVMYDAFIDNIVKKVKALESGVGASIQFELWNEPARGFFGFADDEAAWSMCLLRST